MSVDGKPMYGGRIEAAGLTKTFGSIRAVDNLSFAVEPGSVTGFLGPNGAGKTTTLRMMLGLVAPTSGTSTIGGRTYRQLRDPLRTVGSVLESSSFHRGRSARNHLRVYCAAAGLPTSRADAVLELVGLAADARRKVKGYSLGMRQRLGLAFAMLGDPGVLILDEPANGLDPEGITWLRNFTRHLAGEGRTVLISSHLLAEVEQTVDRVVILARGRLVQQGTVAELQAHAGTSVVVQTPEPDKLAAALAGLGARPAPLSQHGALVPGGMRVPGFEAAAVGHAAFIAGVELHELRTERTGLEEIFFQLTGSAPGGSGTQSDATPASSYGQQQRGAIR